MSVVTISFVNENKKKQVSFECSWEDCLILKESSDYFRVLFDNITQQSLVLLEDNPLDALRFLLEVIENPKVPRLDLSWDQVWALLSSKWLLSEYVNHYSHLCEVIIGRVVNGSISMPNSMPTSLLVLATNSEISGYYEFTSELIQTWPRYQKKNSADGIVTLEADTKNRQWIFKKKSGEVLPSRRHRISTSMTIVAPNVSSTTRTLATYSSNPIVSIYRIDVLWKNSDENCIIKIKVVPTKVEIIKFWEVIETILTHSHTYSIESAPIHNSHDLAMFLKDRREIWNLEKMKKVLSYDDLLQLIELIQFDV